MKKQLALGFVLALGGVVVALGQQTLPPLTDGKAPHPAALTITAPLDWQVAQRATRNNGKIQIRDSRREIG